MVHRLFRLGLYTKELLVPEIEERPVLIPAPDHPRRVLGTGPPGLVRSASDTDLFHTTRHSTAEHVVMCLLIGPTGSGKTLLLKRLNSILS